MPRSFPYLKVIKCPEGFEVTKSGFRMALFTGPDAEDRAWEYGESYLDDLRYEFERAA